MELGAGLHDSVSAVQTGCRSDEQGDREHDQGGQAPQAGELAGPDRTAPVARLGPAGDQQRVDDGGDPGRQEQEQADESLPEVGGRDSGVGRPTGWRTEEPVPPRPGRAGPTGGRPAVPRPGWTSSPLGVLSGGIRGAGPAGRRGRGRPAGSGSGSPLGAARRCPSVARLGPGLAALSRPGGRGRRRPTRIRPRRRAGRRLRRPTRRLAGGRRSLGRGRRTCSRVTPCGGSHLRSPRGGRRGPRRAGRLPRGGCGTGRTPTWRRRGWRPGWRRRSRGGLRTRRRLRE